MKPHRPYELQEYDPEWPERFLATMKKLKPLFGDNLIEIEHFGSTAIKGMVAKPQIDILAVVKNLDLVKERFEAFEKAGFTPRGRGYVAADDEYFTEDSVDGKRLTSIHTLQEGNPKIADYKIFRDYLRANATDRNLYSQTKQASYQLHPDNYSEYENGKKDVLMAIKDRAKTWARDRGN